MCTAVISGVSLHRSNKKAELIDKLENDVTILQQIAVTDSHVRKIVKEELQPLSANSEKMLASMHNIELYIAEEKGRKSARIESVRRTDLSD